MRESCDATMVGSESIMMIRGGSGSFNSAIRAAWLFFLFMPMSSIRRIGGICVGQEFGFCEMISKYGDGVGDRKNHDIRLAFYINSIRLRR